MKHRLAAGLGLASSAAALFCALALPSVARADDGGSPTAQELLAKLGTCNQVSNGTFHSSNGDAQVPVCQTHGAFTYTSSLSVDCDGQSSDACNSGKDPDYQNDTAVHGSDGRPLNAATTPYVVLPGRSSKIWSYARAGIKPGDVVAVIHGDKVEYAVFGDTGPKSKIGEASYATASALGINPDPRVGGADSGVTYIVFPGTATGAAEDHGKAVAAGRAAAQAFVNS
jgi:hypothetical protein